MYSIFPALNTQSGTHPRLIPHRYQNTQEDACEPDEGDLDFTRKVRSSVIAGKHWTMDRFKMWSGGTEGSVEFPRVANSRANSAQYD